VNNVDDMYRRLETESIRLEGLGLTHLSHEAAALRELAGTDNIDALRLFSSVLEPVSFGERYHQQHTSQLTPLNNLVDAIRPDPPSRHDTNRLTHQFLKAPTASEGARILLEKDFESWIAAAPAIKAQLASSPLLALAEPRAEQLPGLATAGIEALNYLSKGAKAPAGWKQRNLALIEAAKKPQAIVRFTFLSPLEELVNAVAE
jgi:hexosaminidase